MLPLGAPSLDLTTQNLISASGMSCDERLGIAESLYRSGDTADVARRYEFNSRFGQFNLIAELVRRTRLSSGQSIADIACGSGHHLLAFARIVGEQGRAWGFDFSEKSIIAARSLGLQVCVASGDAIPLPDVSLDVLTCSYAIYYLPDLRKALAEWARLLKPGALNVITGPSADSNEELYRFHQEVTGQYPSDADRIALGYVENAVAAAVPGSGLNVEDVRIVSNPVVFPSDRYFLDYWRSTSLFLRTVPKHRAAEALSAGRRLLGQGRGGFTVTKRISVLTARQSE
jgi:ubiquinone/menaquinone biosynthesis C-methylase UbiE